MSGAPDTSQAGAAAGELPQSDALAEATIDSIAELLSRDPEGYSPADRQKVIQALREQRVRWEKAQQDAPAKASKTTAKAASLVGSIHKSVGDLGL